MPPKPLMNASLYDNLNTPAEALDYLMPYLPKHWNIWECAVGQGKLANYLEESGYKVYRSSPEYSDMDFLTSQPSTFAWDCIVTNPPFSQKTQFLKRCRYFATPWALLLPITTLGARRCQQYLDDVQVLFLTHRIDFTGKKAPWFSVAWFTHGLHLPKQMVFVHEDNI